MSDGKSCSSPARNDLTRSSPAELQNIFAVNAFGPIYTARALVRSWLGLPIPIDSANHTALTEIKEKGRLLQGKQVLFVSSISGLVAMSPQNQAAYNGSKAALTMMAKVRMTLDRTSDRRLTWRRVSLANGRHSV
jgi:sorbose reductase